MPLQDYTTKVAPEQTAGDIVALLARKKAVAILMDYDGNGQVVAVSWKSRTPHGDIPFTLPINVEAVHKVLIKQYHAHQVPAVATTPEQARRVAWRITYDWVKAQMALLESEMVTLEQLFLPYMVTRPGETLYERMLANGFKMLGPGNKEEVDGR